MKPFTYSATQRTNGSCILGEDCWRQSNQSFRQTEALFSSFIVFDNYYLIMDIICTIMDIVFSSQIK